MSLPLRVVDLGTVEYSRADEVQRSLLQSIIEGGEPGTLLLMQLEPVITLGANFHEEHLLLPVTEYEARGVQVVRSDRGGDVTYHGPGQLVAYPVFPLGPLGKDVHRWLRLIEEAVIGTLAACGLVGSRLPPHTGVWLEDAKVCAIGIKVKRWVSLHGLALNCSNDLAPYNWIVPCGIREFGVTSISLASEKKTEVADVKPILIREFERVVAQAIDFRR